MSRQRWGWCVGLVCAMGLAGGVACSREAPSEAPDTPKPASARGEATTGSPSAASTAAPPAPDAAREGKPAEALGAAGAATERGVVRGAEAADGAGRLYPGPCAELRDLDADGRVDLEVRWSYDARGHATGYTRRWQPHYRTALPDVDVRVTTDARGKPLESVARVKGGEREVWRQTEAWDAQGRRTRKSLDDGADGEEDEAWEWTYTLDEAGRVVEEVERSLEVSYVGPVRARVARLKERRLRATRTTYDPSSGRPVLRTLGPPEQPPQWRVVLATDEAGRVTRARTTDRTGAVVTEERTAWDAHGNMLSREIDRLELGAERLQPESRMRRTYACWHHTNTE